MTNINVSENIVRAAALPALPLIKHLIIFLYLCVFLLSVCLLHFVAFFHVASLFSTGVDNKKVGVDNEKALELTNSTVFHRGRQ